MTQTSFETFQDLAARSTFVPVCKEIRADMLTPLSAFLKVAEQADYAFLFESVERGEQLARYSFLGKDPFLVLRARGGVTLEEEHGATREGHVPFLDRLRDVMNRYRSPVVPGLPRFIGGAVGFLGYDAARWFEPSLDKVWARRNLPENGDDDAAFMLFDSILAFDHVKHRILVIANARVDANADLETAYQLALAKIHFLEQELDRTLSDPPPLGRDPERGAIEHEPGGVRAGRAGGQGAHHGGRHLPGRAVAAFRDRDPRRPVLRVSRAASCKSVPLHVLHPHGIVVPHRRVP